MRTTRRWTTGWTAVGHLGMDLLLATPYLSVVTVVLTGLSALPAALLGAPILWLGLRLADGAGELERLRLAATTGISIDRPRRGAPSPEAGRATRLFRVLFDGPGWRAGAYLFLVSLWGTFGALLVLLLLSLGLAGVTFPLYAWSVPDGRLGSPVLGDLTHVGPVIVLAVLGVLLLVAAPLLASTLVRVNLALGRALLGPPRRQVEAELNARVDTLTSTREAVVDSVEAERLRIERDLHDGPQQRLVALSMTAGLARHKLEKDPAGAAALLAEVQDAAKSAMVEIRQVARGIHPPVLTDRGLDAALSALAGQSPVPVRLQVDLPHRSSPTVEAIAYFCVSEALTNVAKHAGAAQADVDVRLDGAELVLRVADNGVGGATLDGPGTGLRGLQDRVRAVDGQLLLSSPAGGPTVLEIRLPDSPGSAQPAGFFDEPTAEEVAR